MYWHPEPDDTGFWAVTKHADVVAVSRDSATFSSELGGTFIPTQDEEALASLRLTILNMDPPHHHRYRRLVSRGFTPRRITALIDEIDRRAARVIDGVCEKGEVEFVEEIAAQVPVQMICEMIGLEKKDWPRMFEISNQLIGSRDDPEFADQDPTMASMEIYGLCDAVAADRRENPRDDLMTALVEAEMEGERLSDAELNLFFVTLIVAGNETTRNLINHAHAGPHRPPRPGPAPAGRPDALGHRGRRDAPVGQLDPQLPAHGHQGHRAPGRARSPRATRSSSTTRRPTGTRTSSPTTTPSTSAARPTTT